MKQKTLLIIFGLLTGATMMAQETIVLNKGTIYCSRVLQDTLLVSTDNGIYSYALKEDNPNWEEYAFQGMRIVDFVKSGSKLMVVRQEGSAHGVDHTEHLLLSTDRGETINDITPSDATYSAYIGGIGFRLMPDSPDHVYIVYTTESTNNGVGIRETVDFGSKWTSAQQTDSDKGWFAVDPLNPNHILVYGSNTDAATNLIRETKDGFQTLGILSYDVAEGKSFLFKRMEYSPASNQTLLAATTTGLIKSIDNGLTWQYKINTSDDSHYGFDNFIFNTENAFEVYAYCSIHENQGYKVGIFRSLDLGDSWNLVSEMTLDERPVDMLLSNGKLLFVCASNLVYSVATIELTNSISTNSTSKPSKQGVCYDLSGKVVRKPQKNKVIIQNGKKYIVK